MLPQRLMVPSAPVLSPAGTSSPHSTRSSTRWLNQSWLMAAELFSAVTALFIKDWRGDYAVTFLPVVTACSETFTVLLPTEYSPAYGTVTRYLPSAPTTIWRS